MVVEHMQTHAHATSGEVTVMPVPLWASEWDSLSFAQQRFLLAFSRCPIIRRASRLAQINPTTHYGWLERHARYREAWCGLKTFVLQQLEDELLERAVAGPSDPQSARLLMFALRALAPDKWGRGSACPRCAAEKFRELRRDVPRESSTATNPRYV